MRQLVKAVEKERAEELDVLRNSNREKSDLKESLEAALRTIYSSGRELEQAGRFFTEFC